VWIGTDKIYLHSEGETPALVIAGPGGAVESTWTTIDTRTLSGEEEGLYTWNDVWVLTPTSPLEVGLHQVLLDGYPVSSFEVMDRVEEDAPTIPTIVDEDYYVRRAHDCWSAARLVAFTLEAEYDMVVIQEAGGGTLDIAALAGRVVDIQTNEIEDGVPGVVSFGSAPCIYNWDAEPGDSTRVRLGAFDVAGNFSGWGPWVNVVIPRYTTCGCASAPGEGGWLGVVIAAMAIGRRGRRRGP